MTTLSKHGQPVAENLLLRQFSVAAANRVWVSDVTCIAVAEGWVYLCVMLDLYSRRVVGRSMGKTLGVERANSALLMGVGAQPTALGAGAAYRSRGAVLRHRVS